MKNPRRILYSPPVQGEHKVRPYEKNVFDEKSI